MRKKSRSMLRQFVLSYMAVWTILFVTISACSCFISVRTADRELRRECTALLEESKNTVDLQIDALLNLRIPLVIRDNVLEFEELARPLPTQAYTKLNVLNERLSSYSMMNSFADGLMLYYKNNQVFVSNKAVGIYSEAFYNCWLDYYDISYQEWNDIVHSGGQTRILTNYGTDKAPVMEIVSNLPTTSRAENTVIIFTLGGETLDGVFRSFHQYGEVYFSITDGMDSVYYSNASQETLEWLDGEVERRRGEYLGFQTGSGLLDMTYTVYVPTNAIYSQSMSLLQTYLLIYVVLMLLSALMFWAFTYRNTLPLRRTVHHIAQKQGLRLDGTVCEVDFINEAFAGLFDDMEHLEVTIRNNFMDRLLKGIPLTEGEICCLDSECGRIFSYDHYVAAVVAVGGIVVTEPRERFVAASSMGRILLEQMKRRGGEGIYVHPADYDRAAVIFCFRGGVDQDAVEGWLSSVLGELARMNVHTVCAVGDPRPMCDQVYLSYQNACWLLQNGSNPGAEEILWFSEEAPPMEHYHYPLDAQGKLRNLILEGDLPGAGELLAELFEQNYQALQLPQQEKALFNDVLCNDLLLIKKSVGSLGEEGDRFYYLIDQVKNNPWQESNLKYLQMLAEILARRTAGRRQERENQLVEEVRAYVRAHYGRFDLGLSTIAASLQLNENYLSTFYKQQTGENLSAFIEDVRMRRAVEAIHRNGVPIKEIAEEVGYSNLNTFYKAFKRRYGVPPKKYREQQLHQ